MRAADEDRGRERPFDHWARAGATRGVQRRRLRHRDHAARPRDPRSHGPAARVAQGPARRPRRPLAELPRLHRELRDDRDHVGQPPQPVPTCRGRRPRAPAGEPVPAPRGRLRAVPDGPARGDARWPERADRPPWSMPPPSSGSPSGFNPYSDSGLGSEEGCFVRTPTRAPLPGSLGATRLGPPRYVLAFLAAVVSPALGMAVIVGFDILFLLPSSSGA